MRPALRRQVCARIPVTDDAVCDNASSRRSDVATDSIARAASVARALLYDLKQSLTGNIRPDEPPDADDVIPDAIVDELVQTTTAT